MEININTPAGAGGGGSNAAAGTVGATAPTSASNTGFVDGSGNLQPMTGTVANGPIIEVSKSALPTGAATSAKQPALGTAGTASADVISVQGIASMTALKVDGSAVTQPVNQTQINGVACSTGNGVVGTGVQRVAIASDNTAFAVNATLQAGSAVVGKVTIDQTTPGTTNLVALAANQSVNVAQMNGVATTMGNGIAGTGVQRVAVASDNTPFAVKIDQTTPGTTNLVALAANQSVNNAQINGITPLMGNGVTGTGSQRVTIASDNTAFSVNAKASGKAQANAPVRNDYTSTSVTTGAYVQLVASTTSATTEIEIFDSSGQTLTLATGGAGSEVNQINIFPGGNGRVPLLIAASTRVSVKALSATASVGELDINFYN